MRADIKTVVETCICGASIKVTGEYISTPLAEFHKQHKACFEKPVRHILTLATKEE